MPRYGYYDSEAQPKEPIDELSTGGPLVTSQDDPGYGGGEVDEGDKDGDGDKPDDGETPEHHRNQHSTKAAAKA